ncbi:MAG: hypothetical protein QOD00_664 [Blastocatellia bacterium]|jgi:hypothetical protein|nr:hypothetical protein [Blastocatellia bacterium]
MTVESFSRSADYDLRSLNHERRMLEEYRRGAMSDGSLLQPQANACWRAASFEWQLYKDAETARRLWGEGARALAQGFSRRPVGFDPSPDQFILALHFAIAAREREAFTSLALSHHNLRVGGSREARAFQNSRAHFRLVEGYALVARALIERQSAPARAATESLDAARAESDQGWWQRQYPEPLDAAWRISEHDAVCALLLNVARRIIRASDVAGDVSQTRLDDSTAGEFARVVDETLLRLEEFTEHDVNHHPKLYLWLPGLALCALATSAGLPMSWLDERHEAQSRKGYARLPLALLRNPQH